MSLRKMVIPVMVVVGQLALPAVGGASLGTNGRIAWSRDGDVFTMKADGSDRRRLTGSPRWEVAQWSPDGSRLAVLSMRRTSTHGTQIVLMTPRGTSETILARARFSVQGLTWSPDGSRIAYCDMNIDDPDAAAPYPSAIKVVDVAAADQTRITQFDDRSCAPSWSPDSSRIAFTKPDPVDPEVYPTDSGIYAMDADGSNVNVVIDADDVRESGPAWSPTGDTIAFLQPTPHPDGGDKEGVVRVVSADGTGVATLTEPVDAWDVFLQWAPDGTKLMFWRLEMTGDYETRIGVVNADGSEERLLVSADGGGVWSPDATKIAYSRRGNIFVIGTDGTGRTRLVGGRAFDASPSWQRR